MNLTTLQKLFSSTEDWIEKYGYLIEFGQSLFPLDEDEKNNTSKVEGCLSSVWIVGYQENGKFYFNGDSDSAIVKGLVAVLINYFSGKSAEEIKNSDPEEMFAKLELRNHLSMSRSNGLNGMIKKIKGELVCFQHGSGH